MTFDRCHEERRQSVSISTIEIDGVGWDGSDEFIQTTFGSGVKQVAITAAP
jgi:hypothetical protein